VLANPLKSKKSTKGGLMKRFLFAMLAAIAAIALALPVKADTWQLDLYGTNIEGVTVKGTFDVDVPGDWASITASDISNVAITQQWPPGYPWEGESFPFYDVTSVQHQQTGAPGTWQTSIGFTGNGSGGYLYLTFTGNVGAPPINWITAGQAIYTEVDGTLTDVTASVPEPPGDMDNDDHHHHRHHHHHLMDDDHHLGDGWDHDPTAAVPEPSTWAMMLLGFVGLGFAFRRSRRKAAFA
jgi:hypothetical protein